MVYFLRKGPGATGQRQCLVSFASASKQNTHGKDCINFENAHFNQQFPVSFRLKSGLKINSVPLN
jgi:hypothetical protein